MSFGIGFNMIPSLHHLVEDHFKPKWWQFFRKQKYHVCRDYGQWVIFDVPIKCVSARAHSPNRCARVEADEVIPNCDDECPTIKASDPAFFTKLDEFLARECDTGNRLKVEKFISATMGPQGPPGPMGPPGPPGSAV